jgi:hypothetical protein
MSIFATTQRRSWSSNRDPSRGLHPWVETKFGYSDGELLYSTMEFRDGKTLTLIPLGVLRLLSAPLSTGFLSGQLWDYNDGLSVWPTGQ